MALEPPISSSALQRVSLLAERAQGASNTRVKRGRPEVLQARRSRVVEAGGSNQVGGTGRAGQGGLRLREGGDGESEEEVTLLSWRLLFPLGGVNKGTDAYYRRC